MPTALFKALYLKKLVNTQYSSSTIRLWELHKQSVDRNKMKNIDCNK